MININKKFSKRQFDKISLLNIPWACFSLSLFCSAASALSSSLLEAFNDVDVSLIISLSSNFVSIGVSSFISYLKQTLVCALLVEQLLL